MAERYRIACAEEDLQVGAVEERRAPVAAVGGVKVGNRLDEDPDRDAITAERLEHGQERLQTAEVGELVEQHQDWPLVRLQHGVAEILDALRQQQIGERRDGLDLGHAEVDIEGLVVRLESSQIEGVARGGVQDEWVKVRP